MVEASTSPIVSSGALLTLSSPFKISPTYFTRKAEAEVDSNKRVDQRSAKVGKHETGTNSFR